MINKVTKLYQSGSVSLTEDDIQNHLDEMNALGWSLVYVDNMIGWYRFFWEKPQ